MMKSKEFPKNFLFGSREDYILKTQLESISAQREGNVEFTAQNTQSMHSTLAPPNTPWSPEGASQDHQDSHNCPETRQNIENGHHSSIKSQSRMASFSEESFEHWKTIAIISQKENGNLKSQLIEVKAQNTNLIDARNRREISKGSTETIWYALLQQNWQQVQRIKELEKDASFRNLGGQLEVRLSSKQIDSFMEKMRLALESIMHKNGIILRTNMDIRDINTDLQHLFHLLYGAESNLRIEKLMKNLDPQLLLRGLALAAVKQWVFMTDFPVFKENRLSLAQMKVVSQKGDWKCARKLALESYISIIRDPSFSENDLREETQNLVSRFSKAIAPLCKPPHNSEKILSNIWVDSEGTVGTLFITALTFKASTVATGQQYELVVYPPGTATSEAMPVSKGIVASEQPGKDLTCEVWRHASLFVYETETASKWNDPAGMMNKPNNFIIHEAGVREKKSCLTSELVVSKKFDEIRCDANEEIILRSKTGLGKKEKAKKDVKGHQITAKVGDAANIRNFSTKNGLQRGIGPSIIDQTGRYSQESPKKCGETPRDSSSHCSTCLNLYPEAILEEHLKKRPVWCQSPCSICSEKYTRMSDIAKHKQHQKNQRFDAEFSGTKKIKASPLEFLVEVAKKKIDADRVTTVAKAGLPQKTSGKSRQRSNRRSTRLNGQEGGVVEVEDEVPPEVMDDSSPKTSCKVPLDVEAEDLCDTSAVDETETRPVIPEFPSCEKCGATLTSREGVVRHQRMKVCKACPACGNWFGRKQLLRHSCNQQKNVNPDCDKTAITEPHGLGGDEISAAATQASRQSSEDPETESLKISNDDCHELQVDAICSQTSSLLSEFEKSPVLAITPARDPPKRPRLHSDQDTEELQAQKDIFGSGETEDMRSTKLRRLDATHEAATMTNLPSFSDQKTLEFNGHHVQAPIPSPSTTFEFEKWQTVTPMESDERGSGSDFKSLNFDNSAGPRNAWDFRSDYIAFDSHHDTFLGSLEDCQNPFSIPQDFHNNDLVPSSRSAVCVNGSRALNFPAQPLAYENHHTVPRRQPQGSTHPAVYNVTREGDFGNPQQKSGNAIADILNADLLNAEGISYNY
ncbi:uncharacterized protein EAE97_004453 [Botrytis byssoidea]|uniref:C2H2-type domain-containing protein n=1 Tax=Botrytis byssoidea TaxID=139641 RepID=A0A9P5IRB0_9HELO|nr:uncharacterized protein EAE97_004453 [Botrytis byssoidea]KAF7947204.1 hypothetical protein EAE97_004453 [Botrytis byssoidea]